MLFIYICRVSVVHFGHAISFGEVFFSQRFIFRCDSSFKVAALKSEQWGLSAGAQQQPVEAQYQDEFYRACYSLLGSIHLSSEWTGKSSSGRVGLHVKFVGWAIECLRKEIGYENPSQGS